MIDEKKPPHGRLEMCLFEVLGTNEAVWKLYADGRCEGFPEGVVVVNHALPMIHELIAQQLPGGGIANE